MLGGNRAKTGILESSLQCKNAPFMSNDQVCTLSALPILAAYAKNAKVAVSLVVASVAGAKVSPYDESGWVCPPPTRRAAILSKVPLAWNFALRNILQYTMTSSASVDSPRRRLASASSSIHFSSRVTVRRTL